MTQLSEAVEDDAPEFSLDDLFPRNVQTNFPMPEGIQPVLLMQEGRYAAYAYDLDFMWRWVVTRDGEEVQDGPAISLESSRHSARHVMAFFGLRDANVAGV